MAIDFELPGDGLQRRLTREGYESVERMQEASRLTLAFETTNQRLECEGSTPPCVVVTIPCGDTRLWING